jgi:hypothetical protein
MLNVGGRAAKAPKNRIGRPRESEKSRAEDVTKMDGVSVVYDLDKI